MVCATARSGTGFSSRAFTAVGHPCGHEALFSPTRATRHSPALQGDSSWLALPFLDRLPDDVVIYHQVRHPLLVLRSLVGIRMLTKPSQWLDFIEHHHPSIVKHDDELTRCAAYWLLWNETLLSSEADRRVYRRFQIEDLDFDLLWDMITPLGHTPLRSLAQRRFRAIAPNYNTRTRAGSITAEQLTQRGLYDDVATLAGELDYDMPL